jgi:flagellar biosynthesis/type III secretory pathway protein FliH
VGKVRENLHAHFKLDDAVNTAIQYCIDHDIMEEFLKRHGSEVYNMLMAEFNIEEARKVWMEEAWEEGMEKGMEKGLNLKAIEAAVIIIKKWRASLTEAMESVQLDPKYRDHVIAELNKQGIVYTA